MKKGVPTEDSSSPLSSPVKVNTHHTGPLTRSTPKSNQGESDSIASLSNLMAKSEEFLVESDTLNVTPRPMTQAGWDSRPASGSKKSALKKSVRIQEDPF